MACKPMSNGVVRLLIYQVFRRPCLWDQTDLGYNNRNVTNKEWDEIAGILNMTRGAVKRKWKSLRDHYLHELKKVLRRESAGERRPVVWSHFEVLGFLRDQMVRRGSFLKALQAAEVKAWRTEQERSLEVWRRDVANGTDATSQINSQSWDNIQQNGHFDNLEDSSDEQELMLDSIKLEQVDDDDDDESDSGYTPVQTMLECADEVVGETEAMQEGEVNEMVEAEEQQGGSVRSNVEEVLTQLLIHEKKKTSILEKNHHDEDYHFFLSLLPHVRRLPAHRKMPFRMKVQQLVFAEVYSAEPADDHDALIS